MKHHGWSRKDDFKRGDGFIHSRWGHSIFGSPTVEKNYGVVLDVSLVPERKVHYVDGTSSVIAKPWWRADVVYTDGRKDYLPLTCMEKL